MFCALFKVLWRKTIQFLSNKTTPHFKVLSTCMSSPNYTFMMCRLYIDPMAL